MATTAPPRQKRKYVRKHLSKSQMARDAGMSKRRKDQALRLARIPDDVFDAMVDDDNPASIAELERLGTMTKPKPEVDHSKNPAVDALLAADVAIHIRSLLSVTKACDPARAAIGMPDLAAPIVRSQLPELIRWLRKLNAEPVATDDAAHAAQT